ncbi:hypothetical protein M0811_05233 [Anaeramoeba ignava]|uniref:Uncharacterized protein n=1 Tax=Anaeramoeba ignava TaxID=1746090 RepID=A0A9Q0LQK2_ANAIG|nr:hypothetical protein M0811_05233 [Anaeramoeba ignava]
MTETQQKKQISTQIQNNFATGSFLNNAKLLVANEKKSSVVKIMGNNVQIEILEKEKIQINLKIDKLQFTIESNNDLILYDKLNQERYELELPNETERDILYNSLKLLERYDSDFRRISKGFLTESRFILTVVLMNCEDILIAQFLFRCINGFNRSKTNLTLLEKVESNDIQFLMNQKENNQSTLKNKLFNIASENPILNPKDFKNKNLLFKTKQMDESGSRIIDNNIIIVFSKFGFTIFSSQKVRFHKFKPENHVSN